MEENYLKECNKKYTKLIFSNDALEALENCGITPNLSSINFYQNLAELIDFVNKNHRFPNNQSKEETRLRSWLKRAILGYSLYFDKEKAKSTNKYYTKFSDEEITVLKRLNFPRKFLGVFDVRINREGIFEYYIEDLEKLQQYVKENHKFPMHKTREENRLRCWIKNMCIGRESYYEKLKNNAQELDDVVSQRFNKDVIDYLDSFNFPWNAFGWSCVFLDEEGKFVAIPKERKNRINLNENDKVLDDNGKGQPGE